VVGGLLARRALRGSGDQLGPGRSTGRAADALLRARMAQMPKADPKPVVADGW